MRADVLNAKIAMETAHRERTLARMQAAIEAARFELSCSGLHVSERELLARHVLEVEAEMGRLRRRSPSVRANTASTPTSESKRSDLDGGGDRR